MENQKEREIPKNFDAQQREPEIYELWEKSGLFKPEVFKEYLEKRAKISGSEFISNQPFVMTLPPPNANGDLHLGHTCGYSFQDAMGRFNRILGRPTLLLPGKDHASIQTEAVFARKLQEEGKSKWEMGREKFYEECYEFCMKNADNARKQEKRIGLSSDWERELFTLDPQLNEVIYETFFKMIEDGMVYRGKYIINQCPYCRTALADIDTEHKENRGIMARITYPFLDEEDEKLAEEEWKKGKKFKIKDDEEKEVELEIPPSTKGITVATTRPETMLGDTAVAVHPYDPRYKKFIGKKVRVPFVDREIEIIADKSIEMDFGMGALKVTPAHSPADFELGREHDLEIINVIDKEGKMTAPAPERFIGMETIDCSKALVKELDEMGLLVDIENIKHDVVVCERCAAPIQHIMSNQWFVNVKPLADKVLEKIEDGETRVIPEGQQRALEHFYKNIQPWCISRQLWWGQRIPVWYSGGKDLYDWMINQKAEITDKYLRITPEERKELLEQYKEETGKKPNGTGRIFAQHDKPEKDDEWEGDQSEIEWEQEEDIFDTWFSSAQWPYSTLGGPGADDFKKYYPTDVMETARDILFWWVARMLMMGIYRTGEVPFHTTYLHAMILASDGTKMSKSRGNGVPPMDIVEQYGADALRLWYLNDTSPGMNTPLREEKIKGNRNFVNKIWNAFRFILMNIEEGETGAVAERLRRIENDPLQEKDEKIDAMLQSIGKVVGYLRDYRFNLGAEEIRDFFWHTTCDIWIEETKDSIQDKESGDTERVNELAKLIFIMKEYLKVMHPFIPFITEAVWQELVKLGLAEGLLMAAQFSATE